MRFSRKTTLEECSPPRPVERRGQVRMKAEESAAGIPYVAPRAKFGRSKALYGKMPLQPERQDTVSPQAPEFDGHIRSCRKDADTGERGPPTGGRRTRSGSANTPQAGSPSKRRPCDRGRFSESAVS